MDIIDIEDYPEFDSSATIKYTLDLIHSKLDEKKIQECITNELKVFNKNVVKKQGNSWNVSCRYWTLCIIVESMDVSMIVYLDILNPSSSEFLRLNELYDSMKKKLTTVKMDVF
jgi:hypothetical protein